MNLIEFIGQYDTDIKLDISRSKGNDSNIHYYLNIRDTINNYSCEIKSGGCLQGFSGRGTTLLNALNDLSEEIRNTTIVSNAMGKNRKECIVWKIFLKTY